jgi:competence transcription factor ComK
MPHQNQREILFLTALMGLSNHLSFNCLYNKTNPLLYIFQHWRWRQQTKSKHRHKPTWWSGATTQKATMWTIITEKTSERIQHTQLIYIRQIADKPIIILDSSIPLYICSSVDIASYNSLINNHIHHRQLDFILNKFCGWCIFVN